MIINKLLMVEQINDVSFECLGRYPVGYPANYDCNDDEMDVDRISLTIIQ